MNSQCVEVATDGWRKSTHSGGMNSSCVEVAADGAVLIRDTTDRAGVTLSVSGPVWAAFLTTLR
jgi:hypothetical protein